MLSGFLLFCFCSEQPSQLGWSEFELCGIGIKQQGEQSFAYLQAGTELEVEEEPEPAPYAKTLTLDRPW